MTLSDSTIKKSQYYESIDPDVRLMLQVQADHAEAFEELTRRYQNRLLHVMEHLVRNKDQAQDLAQEVFLRVYRSRKTYIPGAKFSTWFFTIANNVANNALRNRSRRKEINLNPTPNSENGVQSLETMAKDASGLMPSRQLDSRELGEVVRAAIDTALNERQKMALLLSKFENMSYQEIAETMDLSLQAVKSLLSRARTSLKTALDPYFQSGHLPESYRGSFDKENE
ncbi:sigma-70 family RNA polymerase sigma factor [Pirellulaceae bacterium]|nr:sigma-70 family RNA polymerase sigma factor [Pirellulaceae bacterium]MDB4650398.1 sigma-70 family RNA polymerase sigma factor [Pirellulaceae bacterium]